MSGPLSLAGKVCVITGATRGIGLASARLFARCGATVLAAGRDPAAVEKVCAEIRAECGPASAEAYACDVSREAGVSALFKAIAQRPAARVDVLLANAGVLEDALIGMVTREQLERIFAVNTFGVVHCAQYAGRLMARTGGGSIITVASIVGVNGNEGQAAYAGSKAAVIGITRSLAKELAPKNIRVNALAPGFIDTDMTRRIPAAKFEQRVASIRMGRIGQPEDVANAAGFLASDLSSYVTGQVIGVDGGMLV